ncbi:hypothetical protein B0H12DRAFT_276125 [Mycena haematopus]|nr:hypothetical protein B0H12DRAFT_276125 [Mycena haematopus]
MSTWKLSQFRTSPKVHWMKLSMNARRLASTCDNSCNLNIRQQAATSSQRVKRGRVKLLTKLEESILNLDIGHARCFPSFLTFYYFRQRLACVLLARKMVCIRSDLFQAFSSHSQRQRPLALRPQEVPLGAQEAQTGLGHYGRRTVNGCDNFHAQADPRRDYARLWFLDFRTHTQPPKPFLARPDTDLRVTM